VRFNNVRGWATATAWQAASSRRGIVVPPRPTRRQAGERCDRAIFLDHLPRGNVEGEGERDTCRGHRASRRAEQGARFAGTQKTMLATSLPAATGPRLDLRVHHRIERHPRSMPAPSGMSCRPADRPPTRGQRWRCLYISTSRLPACLSVEERKSSCIQCLVGVCPSAMERVGESPIRPIAGVKDGMPGQVIKGQPPGGDAPAIKQSRKESRSATRGMGPIRTTTGLESGPAVGLARSAKVGVRSPFAREDVRV
jgi:hypothetical protein